MNTNSILSVSRAPRARLRLCCIWLALLAAVAARPLPAAAEAANPTGGDAKKEEKTEQGGSSLKGLLGPGGKGDDAPLFVKSDTLNLDSKQRIFTYGGNVEIVRGDIRITADRVIGKYDDKNQLQTVVCEENVVVTRGDELRASANRAVYRFAAATIVLTENPELARRGNILSADRIIVYVNEDRSEAEGNVRVKVINATEPGSEINPREKLTGRSQDEEPEKKE